MCNYIKKVLSQTDSLESLYHVTGIAEDIRSCASSQLLSDAGKKVGEVYEIFSFEDYTSLFIFRQEFVPYNCS